MSKVSIDKTTKKYHGQMAAVYDAKRIKQRRWHEENEAVEEMMKGLRKGATVLDCPVGTGRFLKTWEKMGYRATGLDASDAMLDLAKRKSKKFPLVLGSATELESMFKTKFDAGVCVRFLDLIDEGAMREVVGQLSAVVKSRLVLTIRLGSRYVPKVNTAEHDEKKFRALMSKHKWKQTADKPIFEAGWHVLRFDR